MKPKVLLDTCLISHYWEYKINKCWSPGNQNIVDDVKSFDSLLARSLVEIFYNATIEHELPDDKKQLWDSVKKDYNAIKVPIPLSLCDGTYKYDGSLMYGGVKGGSLEGQIPNGYIEKMKKSSTERELTKARNKRNDIEFLETVLEHRLDYFLTTDYGRISTTISFAKNNPNDHNYCDAANRIIRPSVLLAKLVL
jgi:hypothetical protein